MGRFIIDADTRRAWKSVGDTGCRASSVASEHLSAQGVEFPSGRARSDRLDHGLAGFGDNTTSTNECIEIFLLVNCHFGILRRTVTPPSRPSEALREIAVIAFGSLAGWQHQRVHFVVW